MMEDWQEQERKTASPKYFNSENKRSRDYFKESCFLALISREFYVCRSCVAGLYGGWRIPRISGGDVPVVS